MIYSSADRRLFARNKPNPQTNFIKDFTAQTHSESVCPRLFRIEFRQSLTWMSLVMSFTVEFQKREIYDSLQTGINIEVHLRADNLDTRCFAKIESGAEVCLFERKIAETLEIDVESCYRGIFSTLAGDLAAYQHDIELETLGLRFQTKVYFAEDYAVRRNLLGWRGWLQLVTFGLNDYDCELYLNSRFG